MALPELLRHASFRAIDIVRGGRVSRHLKELEEMYADPELCDSYSGDRVETLLQHAISTTRYYRKFEGARALSDLPLLKKSEITKHRKDFISDAFDPSALVPATTSGSYGTPFTFLLTKEKKARQLAEVLYFGEWANYRIGTRHAYVVTRLYPWHVAFIQNKLPMNPTYLTEEWLAVQRVKLRSRRIRVMIGYASAIAAIAQYCRAQGDSPEDLGVQGIMTISEPLLPEVRTLLQSTFGCTVLSRYSTEELGVLAMQHPVSDLLHVNTASYAMEFLSLDSDRPARPGEAARVVVTDLFSHAMPLIRYDLGDIAVLDRTSTDQQPLLTRVEGRTVEEIRDVRGQRVSPFAINGAMRDFAGILQFQFVQRADATYLVRLVTTDEFNAYNLVIHRFTKILGDGATIQVETVPEIPPLRSGKRPYILSELARNHSVPQINDPDATT